MLRRRMHASYVDMYIREWGFNIGSHWAVMIVTVYRLSHVSLGSYLMQRD